MFTQSLKSKFYFLDDLMGTTYFYAETFSKSLICGERMFGITICRHSTFHILIWRLSFDRWEKFVIICYLKIDLIFLISKLKSKKNFDDVLNNVRWSTLLKNYIEHLIIYCFCRLWQFKMRKKFRFSSRISKHLKFFPQSILRFFLR